MVEWRRLNHTNIYMFYLNFLLDLFDYKKMGKKYRFLCSHILDTQKCKIFDKVTFLRVGPDEDVRTHNQHKHLDQGELHLRRRTSPSSTRCMVGIVIM